MGAALKKLKKKYDKTKARMRGRTAGRLLGKGRKLAKRRARVVAVHPTPLEPAAAPTSTTAASPAAAAVVDLGVDPAPVDDGDGAPVAKRARGDGVGRAERQQEWGQFSLAEVWRGGQFIAWGANCMRHRDVGDGNVCQKQVTFKAGSSQAVKDEAQRLAKVWLLLGLDAPEEDPEGRSKHLKEIGGRQFRLSAPDWSVDECEGRLLASLG